MSRYFHVCIGCLSTIPITKQWWEEMKRQKATVCDDCFFDIADIIDRHEGKECIMLIKAYQKIHKKKGVIKV